MDQNVMDKGRRGFRSGRAGIEGVVGLIWACMPVPISLAVLCVASVLLYLRPTDQFGLLGNIAFVAGAAGGSFLAVLKAREITECYMLKRRLPRSERAYEVQLAPDASAGLEFAGEGPRVLRFVPSSPARAKSFRIARPPGVSLQFTCGTFTHRAAWWFGTTDQVGRAAYEFVRNNPTRWKARLRVINTNEDGRPITLEVKAVVYSSGQVAFPGDFSACSAPSAA